MKFLQKLREKIGFSLLCLNAKKVKRDKAFYNLNSASSIGLLVDASQQNCFIEATALAKELEQKGKNVRILAMAENAAMVNFFPEKEATNFFRLDNLSFFGYPLGPDVEKFISVDFDILLNLCIRENLSTDYVMGMSKAKLKVSIKLRSMDFADFILDYNADNKPDIQELIKRIKEYLSALNKA